MKELKKLLLITFLNIAFFSNAQESKFELTANGYEPKVFELPNQNKEEIYNLTKKWIIKTYKNPKEVLTADIENENVKLNGFSKNIVKFNSGPGWDLNYTLEIEFKENRYRLSITVDIAGDQIEYPTFFKKDGSKKTGYKGGPETIDNHLNSLAEDLNKFLKNKGEDAKW
jgi:hypothetical protein